MTDHDESPPPFEEITGGLPEATRRALFSADYYFQQLEDGDDLTDVRDVLSDAWHAQAHPPVETDPTALADYNPHLQDLAAQPDKLEPIEKTLRSDLNRAAKFKNEDDVAEAARQAHMKARKSLVAVAREAGEMAAKAGGVWAPSGGPPANLTSVLAGFEFTLRNAHGAAIVEAGERIAIQHPDIYRWYVGRALERLTDSSAPNKFRPIRGEIVGVLNRHPVPDTKAARQEARQEANFILRHIGGRIHTISQIKPGDEAPVPI